MIHDATVEVTCDGTYDYCRESLDIALPLRYPEHTGKNGWYDHRDATVNRLVRQEAWEVDENETAEDRHFCPGCAQLRKEES